MAAINHQGGGSIHKALLFTTVQWGELNLCNQIAQLPADRCNTQHIYVGVPLCHFDRTLLKVYLATTQVSYSYEGGQPIKIPQGL